MKKSILITFMVIAGSFAANAQNAAVDSKPEASVQIQSEKVKIEADQLPEAVKKGIAESKYGKWTIASAQIVKGETETYELEMKNAAEVKTVLFSKDGKLIEKASK